MPGHVPLHECDSLTSFPTLGTLLWEGAFPCPLGHLNNRAGTAESPTKSPQPTQAAGLGHPALPATMGTVPSASTCRSGPHTREVRGMELGVQSDDMFKGTEIASKKNEV